MKFERQIPSSNFLSHKDSLCLSFLWYDAKFWAKIPKNGHYVLIGARWGETVSCNVIDFNQWEHAKICIVL